MVAKKDQTGFDRPHTAPPVTSVYRMFSPEGMANGHEPHYHPDTIEICFVARGHLDWWVADEAYEIHSGDVLAIQPGVPHGSVDSTLQPCEYYAVHLAPEELSLGIAEVATGLEGRFARRTQTGEWVRRIFDEHRVPGPCSSEVTAALTTLLVTSLAQGSASEETRKASRLVRRAQAALEEEGTTVDDVAKRLGVSSVWLNRLFQQELGESPGGWARSRRLTEAKRLLALDRISVTEIAVRLGYTSSQYFATAFRHECGMTPSAYRALCAATWKARSGAAVCAPMR